MFASEDVPLPPNTRMASGLPVVPASEAINSGKWHALAKFWCRREIGTSPRKNAGPVLMETENRPGSFISRAFLMPRSVFR